MINLIGLFLNSSSLFPGEGNVCVYLTLQVILLQYVPMPLFQPGQRPESIARFVGMTEYPAQLNDRIEGRRRSSRESGALSSVSALAHLFMETGGRYIQAVNDELPSNTPELHPYHLGGFGRLPIEDQANIKQAYAAVIIGAAVLSLTDLMAQGTFDREYFLAQYNHHMSGTAFPTVTVEHMPLRQGLGLNEDGGEMIHDVSMRRLEKRFQEAGFADFLDAGMWESLPPSFQDFVRLQGWDLANDIRALYKQFAERARVLVKQRRDEQAAVRRTLADVYAAIDFSLDPDAEQS